MAPTPPPSSDHAPDLVDPSLFDPSKPFRGIVVCCTSIPPEHRSDIAKATVELGGVHKLDLTPDITHLIVGEYDTPKYRHVARQRPDIRPMAAGWVAAVRDLWMSASDIDLPTFDALEKEWQLQPFETGGLCNDASDKNDPGSKRKGAKRLRPPAPQQDPNQQPQQPALYRECLLCCLTGFRDPSQQQLLVDKIKLSGGCYTPDLTRRVTHLVVFKPEGRKYQAAQSWGVRTVSAEWILDSAERGMILEETCYDPLLPPDERGKGAWVRQPAERVSLGKRLRDSAAAAQQESKKRLKRTTSMKLMSQRDSLWGDILGQPQSVDQQQQQQQQQQEQQEQRPTLEENATPAPATNAISVQQYDTALASTKSPDAQPSKTGTFGSSNDGIIFASCAFYLHNFAAKRVKILAHAISSFGGLVCPSLDELVSEAVAQMAHRFLLVSQTCLSETHPVLPESAAGSVHTITEFYIERCMHRKRLLDPSADIFGRPFAKFPIPGFDTLSICTSGFTDVNLLHVDKAIHQLGARYVERFDSEVTVLVVTGLLSAVRKQKLDMAVRFQVPVVQADWLWECIAHGEKVSFEQYLFPELGQDLKHLPGKGRGAGGRGHQDEAMQQRQLQRQGSLAKKASSKSGQGAHDPKPLPAKAASSSSKLKLRGEVDPSAFAPEGITPPKPTNPKKAGPFLQDDDDDDDSNAVTFETAATHQVSKSTALNRDTTPTAAPLAELSNSDLNRQSEPLTSKHSEELPQRKPLSRITSEIADSDAAPDDAIMVDDDEDMATGIHPRHDNLPSTALSKPDQEHKTAEAQQEQHKRRDEKQHQQQQQEGQRQAAQEKAKRLAAERLAISNKLTALLGSAGPSGSGGEQPGSIHSASTSGNGVTALPSASGGGGSGGVNDEVASAGALSGSARRFQNQQQQQQPRHRRTVMGRAVSNVSAASSGSGSEPCAAAAAAAGSAISKDNNINNKKSASAPPAPHPPPPPLVAPSQVEYRDPEAKKHKNRLMSKMLGGDAGDAGADDDRLTLSDLVGFGFGGGAKGVQEGGRGVGGGRRAAATGAGGRASRRRG